MGDTAKPSNCNNCYSEDILGPYGNHQTTIQIGYITVLEQDVYVCAECGYTMQFTVEREVQRLAREEARKQKQEKT